MADHDLNSANAQWNAAAFARATSRSKRFVTYLLLALITVATGVIAAVTARWVWNVATTSPPPPPPPKRALSVEETVGLVFLNGVPSSLRLNANPEAAPIVIRILQTPALEFYHGDAVGVLAYIGDASTVPIIEQEIRDRSRIYQPGKSGGAYSLIHALGIMARNGVEPAADCLRRMTTETYWNEVVPKVYSPGRGGALTDTDVMKRVAILAYALSNNPDVNSVVQNAVREIPDSKRRFHFEQGVSKKHLESVRRSLSQVEAEPCLNPEELYVALRASWNCVSANPLPTNPRTFAPGED